MRVASFGMAVLILGTVAIAGDPPAAPLYKCREISAQFRLPDGWTAADPAPGKPHIRLAQFVGPTKDDKVPDNFSIIEAETGDKSLTLEDAVKQVFPIDDPTLTDAKYLGAKKARFAGHEAYRATATGKFEGIDVIVTQWAVVKGSKCYVFAVLCRKGVDPLFIPSVMTIVESLKIG